MRNGTIRLGNDCRTEGTGLTEVHLLLDEFDFYMKDRSAEGKCAIDLTTFRSLVCRSRVKLKVDGEITETLLNCGAAFFGPLLSS